MNSVKIVNMEILPMFSEKPWLKSSKCAPPSLPPSVLSSSSYTSTLYHILQQKEPFSIAELKCYPPSLSQQKTYFNNKSAELLSFQHCPRTISNFIKSIRLFHLTTLEEINCNAWKRGSTARQSVGMGANIAIFTLVQFQRFCDSYQVVKVEKKCAMFVPQLSASRERPKAFHPYGPNWKEKYISYAYNEEWKYITIYELSCEINSVFLQTENNLRINTSRGLCYYSICLKMVGFCSFLPVWVA